MRYSSLNFQRYELAVLNNLNTGVFVTNKRCLKLVEKLINGSLVINSNPYGIFTSNRGI